MTQPLFHFPNIEIGGAGGALLLTTPKRSSLPTRTSRCRRCKVVSSYRVRCPLFASPPAQGSPISFPHRGVGRSPRDGRGERKEGKGGREGGVRKAAGASRLMLPLIPTAYSNQMPLFHVFSREPPSISLFRGGSLRGAGLPRGQRGGGGARGQPSPEHTGRPGGQMATAHKPTAYFPLGHWCAFRRTLAVAGSTSARGAKTRLNPTRECQPVTRTCLTQTGASAS